MTKTTIKRIKLIYKLALSLLLVASGILLMVGCVDIYRIGSRPFTPENIGNAFAKIRIPIFITVAAVAVGVILWLFLPDEKRRVKAAPEPGTLAARLLKRVDLNACDPGLLDTVRRERHFRWQIRFVVAVTCVEALLPGLVYVMKFSFTENAFAHFDMDYNNAIIAACLWLLPSLCIMAGFCLLATHLNRGSAKLELEAVKQALAAQGKPLPVEKKTPERSRTVWIVRIVLLVAAIAMIIAGIVNGGMADVLAKAINICTECIGLG